MRLNEGLKLTLAAFLAIAGSAAMYYFTRNFLYTLAVAAVILFCSAMYYARPSFR